MKKLAFTIVMSFLLLACSSVDKLIENGDYDQALKIASQKLIGKKRKKTKYVRALEEAFKKINARDLNQAERLLGGSRANKWVELHQIYTDIDKRQSAILPLLPLVSKDGYKAKFRFIKTNSLIKEADAKASSYFYDKGMRLLKAAQESRQKETARDAYYAFENTYRYNKRFDVAKHIETAKSIGTTHALVNIANETNVFLPAGYEDEVMRINLAHLNKKWIQYSKYERPGVHYDVRAILHLRNIDVSPERETINNYEDTKEIKDGKTYVLDDNGNVMKDSLGNDIKTDKYVTIRAKVREIIRTKAAVVRGELSFTDLNTRERIRTRPILVETIFDDRVCLVDGNKDAVDDSRKKYINAYPAPFPTDLDLIMKSATDLKIKFMEELEKRIY